MVQRPMVVLARGIWAEVLHRLRAVFHQVGPRIARVESTWRVVRLAWSECASLVGMKAYVRPVLIHLWFLAMSW